MEHKAAVRGGVQGSSQGWLLDSQLAGCACNLDSGCSRLGRGLPETASKRGPTAAPTTKKETLGAKPSNARGDCCTLSGSSYSASSTLQHRM